MIMLPVILLFLFYGLWHVALAVMSCIVLRRARKEDKASKLSAGCSHGRVAILLTVCDDFDKEAADAVAKQECVPFDLFVLDDSAQESHQRDIDAWASGHSGAVRVLRRPTRHGFKAGNINYWLSVYGEGGRYSHVLFADADVVMPRHYLHMLCGAAAESDVAFVQGCHQAREGKSWLERVAGPMVVADWLGFLPARNIWGLPQTLGHGVLIRLDDLLDVGGVPEVVSEDLALTIHLAERGRRGMVCPRALAEERLPETLHRYRKRLRRWIAADTQIVRIYFIRIIRSSLTPSEKLDLLLRETRLPMLSLFVVALFAAAGFAGVAGSPAMELPTPVALLGLMVWAGLVPALWTDRGTLLRRVRFLMVNPFLACGLWSVYPASAWRGWRGRVGFSPTNSVVVRREKSESTHPVCAVLGGGLLLAVGLSLPIPALAAVGVAMCTNPWLANRRASMLSVIVLSLLFWLLFVWQWLYSVSHGSVSIEALLVVAGLSASRD